MSHTYSNGEGEWDVPRLWAMASDLPVVEMDPEAFHEWDEYGWEIDLTLGLLSEHVQRAMEADLQYPVIVSAEGNIMDGNHRLLKAKLDGVLVKMVRFPETPPPDRVLRPKALPAPWHRGDPREVINKRAKIVIHAGDRALLGQVETKNVYCILTDHEPERYRCIQADEEWPAHWVWTFTPRVGSPPTSRA